MCILLFPFPKIQNPQKSLDVFLFRSLQLYWSVTILLDLLGKKWKFRLLRPLQQPILNWSSSFVLCLMPGCNMFGEVMASHIILRNTTTTNYVTGKPYTHIIRWPILSPKVVHSKIVFAIFITFFQFPGPFSPGHILHIISNKIWPLWNPDFFLLVLSLHQKSGSLNISQIWEFKDIGVRKRFLFRTGGRAGLIGTFTIQYPCLETPPRIILIPSSHLENTNSYDWSRNILSPKDIAIK